VGLPCYFIRTAVCDIRCSWCDTPQALSGGEFVSRDELLETIPQKIRLVQITGGEPLVQKPAIIELSNLISAAPYNKKILLETGGHRSLEGIPQSVHIVMDIKLPGSGEGHHPFAQNFRFLKKTDEIKFVVRDRADFEAAKKWILENDLETTCEILFSPVWGELSPKLLTEWVLEESIEARIQIQLHKVIWGASAIGV